MARGARGRPSRAQGQLSRAEASGAPQRQRDSAVFVGELPGRRSLTVPRNWQDGLREDRTWAPSGTEASAPSLRGLGSVAQGNGREPWQEMDPGLNELMKKRPEAVFRILAGSSFQTSFSDQGRGVRGSEQRSSPSRRNQPLWGRPQGPRGLRGGCGLSPRFQNVV